LAINDQNIPKYINCAEAFFIKTRTVEGLKNEDSGQFINLELSKIDKRKAEKCACSNEELEELIKNKFQLTQFS
jgi:CBS domain-containing protein